ncbi:MAG: hypothetical protein ABEH66_08340 [Halobacteriales archaeon]
MFAEGGIDAGRFARSLILIVLVTAVFLFIAAERLDRNLFRIGAVAIGSVAIVTAITTFLIAASTYLDGDAERK